MTPRAAGFAWLFVLGVLGLVACGGEDDEVRKDAGLDAAPPCSPAGDAASGFLPCDVEGVLQAKCQRCHSTPQQLASCLADDSCVEAPFPLRTFADTRRTLGGERALLVYERMAQVIASGEMPFQLNDIAPPVEPLTDAEKGVLLGWIAACAPSADAACAP